MLPVPVPEVQGQGNWESKHMKKKREIKVSEYLTTDRPGHLRGSYAVSGVPVGLFAISNIVLKLFAVVLGMKSLAEKNCQKKNVVDFVVCFDFSSGPCCPEGDGGGSRIVPSPCSKCGRLPLRAEAERAEGAKEEAKMR